MKKEKLSERCPIVKPVAAGLFQGTVCGTAVAMEFLGALMDVAASTTKAGAVARTIFDTAVIGISAVGTWKITEKISDKVGEAVSNGADWIDEKIQNFKEKREPKVETAEV